MSDRDPFDPNAPKKNDPGAVDVDVDFDDDLDGWGEDDEDDGEFSDSTDISVTPAAPSGEDPPEEMVFVDNATTHDDSHTKPTRRYQTGDMPMQPDPGAESPESFQSLLDEMGGANQGGPLQSEMTVENMADMKTPVGPGPDPAAADPGTTEAPSTDDAPPLPDDSELQPAASYEPAGTTQEVPPSAAALFGDDDAPLIAEDTLSRKLDAVFPDDEDEPFSPPAEQPEPEAVPAVDVPAPMEIEEPAAAPEPQDQLAEPEMPDLSVDLAPPGDEPTQDQPPPQEQPVPEPAEGTDPLMPMSTDDWDPDLLAAAEEAHDEEEVTPTLNPTPAGDWSPVEIPAVVEEEADPEALRQAQQPEEPFSIEPLPLDTPLPEGEGTWLADYSLFKNETQSLARQGQWQVLAAVTGHALMYAPYSDSHTRPAMLLDLARIYRDRLTDHPRAEEAFVLLTRLEPANGEALSFLVEQYQERGEWGAIYDLYMSAVEATWDPHERLSWTRLAADLAHGKLDDVSLAIRAWEHLWQLGDAVEDAARELSRLYRAAGRWAEMAAFLGQEAQRLEGAAQLVVLRELAEVTLSGLRDPDGASAVLEQIVERSPQDPIATLQLARVYTQRQDWDGLERLCSAEAQQQLTAEAAQDLQHMVADAFWQANRLEQAVEAYDRVLEVDPADSLGIQRKQEYLTRTDRYEDLLNLLLAKAEAASDDDERAELLARCAKLAEENLDNLEQAARLWEQRIAIDDEHLPSYEALARLYEVQGDLEGVARAMEGQLSLIKDLSQRIELYRKLGEHYAQRMGDDDQANNCWKAILNLDPSDFPAREELIKLHRRAGDFESLNSALARQIWITDDEERALKLARMAAENLDQNFDDAERSVEGWRRVLDFAPMDVEGLRALGLHYETLERRRDLIAVLEQEILALDDTPARIDRALKVARLWEEEEVPRAAAAACERVLRWAPTNREALDRLVETYKGQDKVGMAVGLLEHACTLEQDHDARVALLRRVLDLLPEDDHHGRFYLLRRIFILSDGEEAGEEINAEAGAADLWPEMTSVLSILAAKEPDADKRVAMLLESAGILEEKMEQPDRAYLALQRIFVSANPRDKVLEEVTRLAKETGRFEDLMALLDRFTAPEFDLDRRKQSILQRAQICEKDLEDGVRAFQEHRRLLELSEDREPLAEMERLAEAHDLWKRLGAVLTELGDQADQDDRLELLARREHIWREKLESPDEAFLLLVQRFRAAPQDDEVLEALEQDAEALENWDLVLPMQEASTRCAGLDVSTEGLTATASRFEAKLEDSDRALELTAAAFIAAPDAEDLGPKLEELAEEEERFEALADIFRQAAAVSEDPERTVVLLRRIATIYEEKLDQPGKAIGIYSRLLDLEGDDVESLEVMIRWHREHEEWRDLRDRLHQRVELLEEDDEKVPLLLEIAKISQEQLSDPEEALGVFGQVVEIDPEHEEAHDALAELVGTISEPGPRLRWLTMQLKQSSDERAAELRLEIAQIQEHDQQDRGAAITTLQELVEEAGPVDQGFVELRRLLEEGERWKDLVLLLRDKAGATEDEQEMKASLEEAMFFCNEYLGEAAGEIWEDLYRSMLTINPSDRRIRTHLARYYRQAGRFEELAAMLRENLGKIASDRDRVASRYELARLQALNLDQLEDASSSWMEILEDDPNQEAALLALARVAFSLGDVETYVVYRRQQSQILPPHEAALVLCHLAEVADENEEINDQMVPLYREARTIDPDNVPAMEALKGIGRRLKNLRPAAALLPLDGERDLELSQRAERLKALGDGSLDADLNAAIEWYWRSVAVDPDNPESWLALAEALDEVPDPEGAYRVRLGWQQTFSRLQPMDAEQLTVEAQRQFELASAARDSQLEEEYEHHVGRAYDTVPSYAPAALAMAQIMIEAEETEEAHALLHSILLHHVADLSQEQHVAAHYSRGLTLRQLGRQEDAMADMREVLNMEPLHADSLASMGEMLSESGRCAAAIEIHIRALTAVEDARERAEIFYRLGVLWEDGMGSRGEAGVCYELALAEGLDQRDLLHRSLRHFQRIGNLERSLAMVGSLLPTADDPDELASLWLARGQNYTAGEGREKEAVEAFDMALSYDPACHEARDGLTLVLERLEDWPQLLQVLEATCDVGTAQQQSQALLRMANISSQKLQDPDNAEAFLKRSVDIFPSQEALEQLEQIYSFESGRLEERKDIVGLLTNFGPPWFDRCLELSKLLLAEDKVRAWCLLSPLLGVSQVDPDIKAVIQAMRKEFERPAILCPSAEDYPLLLHHDATPELSAVLAEVSEAVKPLGASTLDAAGDGNAIPIGENTTMGKAFGAVAEAMGLSGCVLHRTQSLDESVCVINSDPDPLVVVRTDVMQQLVHAEVGFLFAYVLELAKPGNRVMAAMAAGERDQLFPALWQAVGLSDGDPGELGQRILDNTDEDQRAAWAEQLSGLAGEDPAALGQRYWNGVCLTARRAGLLAGADLRQVFRVQSRLEEEVSRPRVVARMSELDEYVGSSEILKDLVAFAASPSFGKLMASAVSTSK